MRRLRTAYTGSILRILRIRRSSDNTEQDIGYEADGDLDTAAVSAFVGGGSGYIVKWYDQSGNAYDASQTTTANQPLYVARGQNGRPAGRFDGSNDSLATANNTLFSGLSGFEVLIIIKGSSGATINTPANSGGNFSVESNGNMYVNNTGLVTAAFLGSFELQNFRWNAGATAVWRNAHKYRECSRRSHGETWTANHFGKQFFWRSLSRPQSSHD
ncbi:MAG: hypothetical protein O3B87_04395 [bacterium]|nr:hypothetical protein [bacterium]